MSAGDGAFRATATELHVDLGADAQADLSLSDLVPYLLGGSVHGTARVGTESWDVADAEVYAENNWGAGFPERWWWGQAQGFERADVCVAFSGGVLTSGRLAVTVGGVVVRIGAHVIRLAPPLSSVRSEADGRRWEVRARGHGYRMHITGTATGDPHVLPVPLPAERRNVDTDFEQLAGHLSLEVTGRVTYRGETDLAGLEIGHRPTDRER